jgi:Uma2 family endonuclease
MATGTAKLTHADFLLFPDDGKRHELIDGEHFVSPSAVVRHQRIVGNLTFSLTSFVREHRLGEVFGVPLDVIFSEHDVVEPDILFVKRESSQILVDWCRGVPDLVVEVLSPSNRRYDEVKKRDLYERFGVAEYWIVDPELETVKVYRLAQETYGRPSLLSRRDGDSLSSPLLPGLTLPLADVFAE